MKTWERQDRGRDTAEAGAGQRQGRGMVETQQRQEWSGTRAGQVRSSKMAGQGHDMDRGREGAGQGQGRGRDRTEAGHGRAEQVQG